MIALFRNAREVIRAAAAARKAGVEGRVRPVPEEYSTECGMGIDGSDDRIAECRELM